MQTDTDTDTDTERHYSDAQQCAPIAFDKRLFGCVAYQKAARLRHSNRINHSLVAVFALLFPHFIYLLRLAIKFVFIFVQTLQGCDALRPDRLYFHVPNKRIKNSFSFSFSLLFLFFFPYSHFILIKKHTRVRDVGAQGTGTGTGTGTVCSNFV